jgi:hypothetical protein
MMSISALRGFIEYASGHKRFFYPWGSAMNGMTSRPEAVRQIILALKIERIVETGTFRGTTAEWFARLGLPFDTVELAERFYVFSRIRLRHFSNAKIHLNSSVDFLKERISSGAVTPDCAQLFYLDSHWGEHLPLREEVELIFGNYSNAVVVVDDFQVPDDPGYAFDSYSEDKHITAAYLVDAAVPRPLQYFYPSTKASTETGARSGWCVIVDNPALASELERISLVRKGPMPS